MDANYEKHIPPFVCSQLHYGPLIKAGNLMNLVKGELAA